MLIYFKPVTNFPVFYGPKLQDHRRIFCERFLQQPRRLIQNIVFGDSVAVSESEKSHKYDQI